MDNHFGGVIWTNHAIDRMRERGIKQGDAWATFNRPEQSYKGNLHKGEGAWRFYRTYGSEKIEVVAQKDPARGWIIISVWSDPVYSRSSNKSVSHSSGKPTSFWRWLYNFIFSR